MPTPRQGESESDFVSRCIPMVLEEGTAADQAQAVAVCHSMYKNKGGNKMEKITDRAAPQGMLSSDMSGEKEIRDMELPENLRSDRSREDDLNELLPID